MREEKQVQQCESSIRALYCSLQRETNGKCINSSQLRSLSASLLLAQFPLDKFLGSVAIAL